MWLGSPLQSECDAIQRGIHLWLLVNEVCSLAVPQDSRPPQISPLFMFSHIRSSGCPQRNVRCAEVQSWIQLMPTAMPAIKQFKLLNISSGVEGPLQWSYLQLGIDFQFITIMSAKCLLNRRGGGPRCQDGRALQSTPQPRG